MSPELIRRLIKGEFICEITASDDYVMLSDPDRRREIDDYLRHMGLSVSSTQGETAFYASPSSWNDDSRRDVRETFQTVKNEVRFIVEIFQTLVGMTGSGAVLAPGYVLKKNKLSDTAGSNPVWRDQLKALASTLRGNSTDSANSVVIEKLLKRLVDMGYLQITNKQEEIYRVTGKIDWFHEIIEFIIENEKIPDLEEDENKPQGSLI